MFPLDVIKSFTPADNLITDAKAKLGDMIFDEKQVSADNSVACNTCHSPRNGFTTTQQLPGVWATKSESAMPLRS
jgi:cytochrome c peroxidase